MNSPIKVSVIIPVFNTQKYLRQCVESVLYQTYRNFEIILVNDGSSDSSLDICQSFKQRLPSIINLVNQQNQGLSSARNVGLKQSSGDYVIFLDSDDFWSTCNVLEILVSLIDKHPSEPLDFIMFNAMYYYDEDNTSKMFNYPESLSKISTPNKFEKLIESGNGCMSACMKIIRRSFLLNNNIEFIKGIRGEDSPWFVDLMINTDKFIVINDCLYNYRQQVEGSITYERSLSSFYNSFKLYDVVLRKSKGVEDNKLRLVILSFTAYLLLASLASYCELCKHDRKKIKNKLKTYLYLLKYNLHPRIKLVSFLYQSLGFYSSTYILHLFKMYLNNRRRSKGTSHKETI